jgi:hypothetical protein
MINLTAHVNMAFSRPQNYDSLHRNPREEAGGKWLDPHCSELMDEALWDNLDRLRRQWKWKERGIAE